MSYTQTYKTKEERNQYCDEAKGNGYVMLHDDFTDEGRLLTFDLPTPPTAEELAVEAVEQETAQANDQALVAYQNYGNLSLAQKDIILKALLGDFISRNRDRYIS